MEDLGVVYSVNPWITVGHCDRGRDARQQLPGLQTVVGHDGTRCQCCACPLSEVWRDNVDKVWTLYAQTHPHIIWVEDDIRTFNHSPARYGCFCSEHLRRFSERVGQPVTREQLVAAILKPGRPSRWRREYLDMQAETMVETVGFLAQVVHRTSPDTCLGLMSSGPRNHCLEGRRWEQLAEAMADGQPLYSRPPMGNYNEASLRGFYYSHDSIKITRHCMPAATIEQTEVENVPFTRYSKSAAFTFVEMAISFAYGSHGVTMNLYDHAGTPMEAEPAFGGMLARKKPYLEGLARQAQKPGLYRGVQLLYHERESYSRRLVRGADYGALAADGAATMQLLESHGIPTTYDDENVVATSGQQLRAFSDEEIRGMLSKGVLMGGVAAGILVERGFGKLIGARTIDSPRCIDRVGGPYSAEEYFNHGFGGRDHKFLTLTVPDLGGRPDLCAAELMRETEVISRLVDPDARRGHVSMYAYQNELGGRVAVHLLDLSTAYGIAFNHPFRAEQMQSAVTWLARRRPAVLVRGGVYPLTFRKDLEGSTLLGLFNLSLDPWPEVEFTLADRREVAGLEVLSPKGRWERSRKVSWEKKAGRIAVRYRGGVPHDEPLFVNVIWQ